VGSFLSNVTCVSLAFNVTSSDDEMTVVGGSRLGTAWLWPSLSV